jgi:hypothetical protein
MSNTTSSLGVNPRRFRLVVLVFPVLKLEFRDGGGVAFRGGVLPLLLPICGDEDSGGCSESVMELPIYCYLKKEEFLFGMSIENNFIAMHNTSKSIFGPL